jgi:hypothetical protein
MSSNEEKPWYRRDIKDLLGGGSEADRKKVIILGAAVVIVGIFALVLVAVNGTGGATPISKQDCHQLAATFADIERRFDPSQPFEVKSKATQDAAKLNDRIDALGGCPTEPSLQ